jgi:hypothetical protein
VIVARKAVIGLVVATASLTAAPAFAVLVTPTFEFTNFYTDFVNDTTGDFLVYNLVNGQQLCAFGSAQGSQTTYDCSKDGAAGIELAPGISSVEWQVDPVFFDPWVRNVVTFEAAGAQEVAGIGPSNRFKFGKLTFENGQWSGAYTELSFNLTFLTDDAALNALFDFEYSSNLIIQGTPNLATNTPEQNADFVYIADETGLGSLRAYELFDSPTGSNRVSVDIWGYLSSVHFDSFRDVSGGGFIDTGIALEPSPVPEPSTLALALSGLVSLGGFRLRKPRMRKTR